jgi:hypothetical protein
MTKKFASFSLYCKEIYPDTLKNGGNVRFIKRNYEILYITPFTAISNPRMNSALRGVVLQRKASGKSNIYCSLSLKQHVINKIGVPSFAVFLGLSLHTSCV